MQKSESAPVVLPVDAQRHPKKYPAPLRLPSGLTKACEGEDITPDQRQVQFLPSLTRSLPAPEDMANLRLSGWEPALAVSVPVAKQAKGRIQFWQPPQLRDAFVCVIRPNESPVQCKSLARPFRRRGGSKTKGASSLHPSCSHDFSPCCAV